MSKIAVVLSGCGVYDGSEIHEAVCSLIAIEQNQASYSIFAPDKLQTQVINHITGEEMQQERNVLVEAARIARGKISPLSELKEEDFDAILFPGGFGAAKNLSSFAFEGAEMSVDAEVSQAINAFYDANKPIGALCIAPVLLAKVLGHINVTIGNDTATVGAIQHFGANHIEATNEDVVVDQENKIVTGPCYMIEARISDILNNSNDVVRAMIALIEDENE